MLFGIGKKKPAPPHPELSAIKNAPPDSLTILIPSKGRPRQLAALLRYFKTCRVPYEILVLLSGNRKDYLPDSYPELRLEVVEFSEDAPLFAKLKEGMALLNTPLVAFCADDDIVLPEAIKKCAGFLLQNPAYSAAQGYHGVFSEDAGVVNLMGIPYFVPSVELDSPLARLNALIRRYQPVCWAVWRTQTMREICNNFSPDLNYLFNEFLWSGIAAVTGKVKRLPMIYCMRRMDQLHFMGHPLYAMMENPQKFFLEYASYRSVLLSFLLPTTSIDEAALTRAIDLIHACYFSLEMVPSTFNFFTDHVLADPAASIHRADIDKAMRPALPDTSKGWEKEIRRAGRLYRIFPNFLRPEPAYEIPLPADFVDQIIQDTDSYFD